MTANPEHFLRLAAERGATSPTAECLADEMIAAVAERSFDRAAHGKASLEATGGVVYEAVTSDTTAELPGSVSFAWGRSYPWKVEARTGWNRWSASGAR
ncbi:MAG TPA: hypothetical protein VFU01_02540 [Gemmatimonadaceae bacterium]|nr:hypothetical protein [Gemmatimonadaceae bacterium]